MEEEGGREKTVVKIGYKREILGKKIGYFEKKWGEYVLNKTK